MAEVNGTYIGEAYEVTVNGQKVTMYVYVPKNVKSGSTVSGAVYWNGAGGYARNYAEYVPVSDYYKDNDNVDYVFISMDINRHYDELTDEVIKEVINQVQKDYNINIDIDSVQGLSAGGDEAVAMTLNILRNDPGASPQKMILYDPYASNNGFDYRLSDDDIRLMKQNDTTVFMSLPRNRGYSYRGASRGESNFVNKLAAGGIPTILVDGNFSHGHSVSRMLYDGWTDYLNGYIDLEDINDTEAQYQVSVASVDSDGKVHWQVYKLADLVDAKKHPGNYDADTLRGMNSAMDQLDDMRVELDADDLIRRAGSLLSVFSDTDVLPPTADCSSTSQLIPESYAALTKVRDAFVKMCESAQKEINKAIYAGNEYIALEAELKQNTESLNTLINEKVDDLRIPAVELTVSIDDPDLKKTQKNPIGGYGSGYYRGGGGGGSTTTTESSSTEETTMEEVKQVEEVTPTPVAAENKAPTPTYVAPATVNTSSKANTISNVMVSEVKTDEEIIPDDGVMEDDMIIPDEFVEDTQIDVPEEVEPVTPVTPTPTPVISGTNKSNNVAKAIGVMTTAGAAVAAGVYGYKKYKEHQDGGGSQPDDDNRRYDDIDKAPSSNDEI